MPHQQITVEGRSYQFDPDCNCEGCQGLRKFPEPALCDWCHKVHCGDSHSCSTEEHDASLGVRGADNSDNIEPEENGEYDLLCLDIRARIKSITNYIKENYDMLPRAQVDNSPATPQQRANFENGKGSSRKRDGFPFLNKAMLSTAKKQAKVLDVREAPDNFKPGETLVQLKVALEGKTCLYSLRLNNPMLEVLQDAWGLDEDKWKNQTMSMFLEVDEFTGVGQIRLDPDEEPAATRPKKR
jgi:hypothetical protein